jgi:hypothetical protein
MCGNAMEHLNEADFDEHGCGAGTVWLKSITAQGAARKHSEGCSNRLAGRLAVDDLEERALAMVNKVETEIVDQEEMRGK